MAHFISWQPDGCYSPSRLVCYDLFEVQSIDMHVEISIDI
jgi:hypothetical protein